MRRAIVLTFVVLAACGRADPKPTTRSSRLFATDARDEAEAFMRRYGWTYRSGFDPSGSVMAHLKVLGLPTTFFYRPGGELALVHSGEIHEDQLESKITMLLQATRG